MPWVIYGSWLTHWKQLNPIFHVEKLFVIELKYQNFDKFTYFALQAFAKCAQVQKDP